MQYTPQNQIGVHLLLHLTILPSQTRLSNEPWLDSCSSVRIKHLLSKCRLLWASSALSRHQHINVDCVYGCTHL